MHSNLFSQKIIIFLCINLILSSIPTVFDNKKVLFHVLNTYCPYIRLYQIDQQHTRI